MTARTYLRGILRATLALFFTTCIASTASAQALDLFVNGSNSNNFAFQVPIGTFTVQLNATGGTPPYTLSLTPGSSNVPGMRVRARCQGLPTPCPAPYPMPTNFPANNTGGYLGVLNTE